MQEKTDTKLDFLTKRELERKQYSQNKKNGLDKGNAENEKTDYFERSFNEKKAEILESIESAEELGNRKECAEHFDRIFKDILALQKYVAASNIFLRTYDVKIYQNNINALTNKAKELELKLLPKKKFGFKNKKTEVKLNGSAAGLIPNKAANNIALDENFCGYKNETGRILTFKSEEILKKDVTLHNLTDCTVKVFGSPSTLHINNIKNCTVLTGPVSTSIFADNCTDSKLVISCQQLRLHSSNQVDIYLHVTSRAIMEDCTGIRLAPYNLVYEGIEEDFKDSGLDRAVNHWECVDDFNWLNVEKASPHWGVLVENERVCDWEEFL